MFEKILIANRGEIACRVIKSARAMGIKTVAVYSDADKNAMHKEMADEAVYIGAPPASESYLVMDKILGAIKETGAQAVHPGYGFLSENSAFADALDAAGVAFIGPKKYAIESMGDKITSKKIAAEAGVSTVPGHMGLVPTADEAIKIASEIGYPVMIKATAGGGGKGMRVAYNDEEMRDGFDRATSEARSSFGDDRVFIEKFIQEPRHIEIQVLADGHGNAVYLFERECSIQRRHQKVIEEAPSPFLDEETRKAMGEQAVALAKAVDYQSAGTVEFIVDAQKNFYFLEMNTRLQVEHPVTEMISGVDLVEQMIKIAAGLPMDVKQEDLKINGWALESRVYAEDPIRGFLPSTGRLAKYIAPEGEGVRVDTGVGAGDEISMFYDPMVAKLCTWGKDREEATARMRVALDSYYIRGIGHNINFVNTVLGHKRFQEGRLTTNYIAEEFPEGYLGGELTDAVKSTMVVAAAVMNRIQDERDCKISGGLGSELTRRQAHDDVVVFIGEEQVPVNIQNLGGGAFRVESEATGVADVSTDWEIGGVLFNASLNGSPVTVQVDKILEGYTLTMMGAVEDVLIRTPRAAELAVHMPVKVAPDMSKFLLCPMPGLIISIAVEEGQKVEAGQALCIIEAMKMENVLRAEKSGIVSKINVEVGASLAVDQIIMEFESEAAE